MNTSGRMPVWRRILTLFAVAVALIGQGCGKPASRDAKQKIVVGYLPIVAHLPCAVAESEGAFRDMRFEFRVFGDSGELLNAVARGDIQIATTIATVPVLSLAARTGSCPVRIISYSQSHNDRPFDGVFVLPSSTITNMGQLSGKRIGVFPGDTARKVLSLVLRRDYQVDTTSIQWRQLPPNAQMDALTRGDIDAAFVYETARTGMQLAGMRSLGASVVAQVLGDRGTPYGCTVVNADFARRDPEGVGAFVLAFDKGIMRIRQDSASARRVLESRMGVGRDVAASCNLEERLLSTEMMSSAHEQTLKEFSRLLVEAELLPQIVDPRPLLWTP